MLELACAFLFSQDNNCIIFYYVLDFFHSVSIWRDFWRTVIWHFCSCTLAVPPCARFHGSHVFSDLLTRLKSRPLLRTWEKDKEFPWSVCVARPEEQFETTFSTLLWKMLSVQCPVSRQCCRKWQQDSCGILMMKGNVFLLLGFLWW